MGEKTPMELSEEQMACISSIDYVKDWNTWRNTLKEAIGQARKFGISDKVIQETAVRLGDWLAENVCPATPEESLMKEFWDIATPEERRTLATLMFKLVQK